MLRYRSGSQEIAFSDTGGQVGVLRAIYRCVAPDLPCHGQSPAGTLEVGQVADLLFALLESLGTGPVVLVGHSFSCRVVLEMQRRYPAAVRGLVLVDGSCVGIEGVDAASQPFIGGDADAKARIRGTFESMFFDEADSALRRRLLDRLELFSPATVDALQVASLKWDATHIMPALRSVTVPLLAVQSTCLFVDGVRVQLTAEGRCPWLDLLDGLVPGCAVAVVPGVGHFSMLEAPARVTSAIVTFLRSLEHDESQ